MTTRLEPRRGSLVALCLMTVALVADGSCKPAATSAGLRAVSLAVPTMPPPPPLEVGVDPRVELLCIIFRLAGKPEYNCGLVPTYLADIDQHFATARQHPVIKLTRELGAMVGFDAPMHLAVHLNDADHLALRLPLKPWPEGLDQRWRSAKLKEFLSQARRFVREAKFDEFYRAHQGLYAETAERARRLLITEGRLDWFDAFFGPRPGVRFRFVPGLINGGCCYGARVKLGAEEEVYCILGVTRCDNDGQPVFDSNDLATVAHEFCHSYVGPALSGWAKRLEPSGQRLFTTVADRMQRMAYGDWMTMINESIVRAAVVRYLAATQGPEAATRQVREETARGFLWMDGLSQLLGECEAQRERYPAFRAFMPRIVEFFDQTARQMSAEQKP